MSWERSQSLEKQIMQGTSAGSRTRGRPKTFFNGLDTHWTSYSCILKTESSGHSSFIVWPSLEKRMAESKASNGQCWRHTAAAGVQSSPAYIDAGSGSGIQLRANDVLLIDTRKPTNWQPRRISSMHTQLTQLLITTSMNTPNDHHLAALARWDQLQLFIIQARQSTLSRDNTPIKQQMGKSGECTAWKYRKTKTINKKAESIAKRTARRAMYGCPENFRVSLTTHTATFPEIFNGLLIR